MISLVLMLHARVSHALVTGVVVTRKKWKIPVFMIFVDHTASDRKYTNITFYMCIYTHNVLVYIGIYYICVLYAHICTHTYTYIVC